MSDECADLAIVGAGIAGASLAWQLAPQRRVVLLERESQPGYHATGRSAAMFIESYGPPGVRALTRASRGFLEHPPAGFAEVPLISPRGVLHLAMPGQEAELQALHDLIAPTGTPLEAWDADQTRRRLPWLRPERVAGALHERAAQDLDVHAIHQGFLRGARRAGAALWLDAELRSARRTGDHWRITLADGRRLAATTIVDAAGAWADELAQRCGVAPIGLQPKRRSAMSFDAPPGVDVSAWPAVIAVDESWYLKPDAGRLLGSPANADECLPHDVRPEELDIARAIDRIETATTLTIRRPASTWAGLRSFVADGEIVIGADPAATGFFWLAAQGGYGIQSCVGASLLAAARLTGRPLPQALQHEGLDPAGVSPARLMRPAR